jgi:hypothetical protein
VPDLHIVEPARDVDGWVVTSAGCDVTILLTEDIVTRYVLVDVPGGP